MKKISIGLCAFMGMHLCAFAQQDPQFTMFYFNKMLFNPAYAGAKEAACVTFMGRKQWSGLEGAPSTFMVTADLPITLPGTNNELGLGVTTFGDYIGFNQDHGLRVAMAYRKKNLGPGHLSVGLDVGFMNKAFTNPASAWIYPNTPEPLPNAGTPASTVFDISAGVYYHSQKFYAGFSMLHLTAAGFSQMNMKQARHMYFTGGYTFSFNRGASPWKLNPNLLIRTDMVTANFDVNLNAIYDINGTNGIFFGTTYRFDDAIGLNVGYNGNYFDGKMGVLIGYNYDISTSKLRSFNTGSHELIIRICFSTHKIIHPPFDRWYKKYVNRYGDSIPRKY